MNSDSSSGCVVSGRYIRIDFNRVECLNLAQIFVYSTKDGPNIVRPSTIVNVSSEFWRRDEYPAKNLVDGIGNSFVHTSCHAIPWIEVDLGNTTTLDRIVVWNRKDNGQARILGARLTILSEDRAPVYISNTIDSTAKIYKWLPSSPQVIAS